MPVHLFLPAELYHQIIFYLDVKDVFALRRTCKYFFALTQGLLLNMFSRLRATQALPCSRTEFTTMSSLQAARALFAAPHVEASFLQLREHVAYHIPAVKQPYASMNAAACSLSVLSFVSDRFLLSVDNTAVIIWDASTLVSSSLAVKSSPWAHFTLSNFLDYVDCHSTLYIAIARAHLDNRHVVIYSVPLPSSDSLNGIHPARLHRAAEFPLRYPAEQLKHMDPLSGRALLYSSSTSIQIVHWNDSNRRVAIPVQFDDVDQAWNGITSLRFCGPYILCFRVRSVEAYPIPTDTQTDTPLPLLRHRFGPVCFRAVSLSRVRVSHRRSGDVYTIFMLTNDVYQGMFHYHICLATTPEPSLSVHVLARGSIQTSDPLPLIPGSNLRFTLEDIIRRMFFSTWSLGSAGLRGVWVDRQRGSIDRRVVAFTTHPSRLGCKEAASVPDTDADTLDEPPTIDGNIIHVISSYDLRDDITICAVSEWTGRIALGSRVGAISLL